MSTKIYDAYRLPKAENILEKLYQLKQFAYKEVSENQILLHVIHALTTAQAAEKLKKDPDNPFLQSVVRDDAAGKIDIFWIEECLEEAGKSVEKDLIDVKLSCSVFYDETYWYIKFFVNSRWQSKVLKEAERIGFEDYHYQDQTDPPEDLPKEEFKARGVKWDELTKSSGGNYRNGFQYDIFDAYEFRRLVSKNYYTGEPLYDHLAYKFDEVMLAANKKKDV